MAFPDWTEEHEAFRASVRRFTEEEIRPHAEEWDAKGGFPDDIFPKAGKLGLLGVRFDPKWGGSGLDYWYTVILVEELVRDRDIGAVVGLMVQCEMATSVIHAHGSDALRQEWLVPAIAGERIAALGVSEPGGGSDLASLQTHAKLDGDDYIINGSKIFISNGARADFVTLAVRTGGPGPKGVSLVVCPTDSNGFSVGRRLEKVDQHSGDTVELFFDDMRVPRKNLIGEEGRGFRYIMQTFQGERLVLSTMMNALCRDVMQETLAYIGERKVFGQTIGSMQVWRHRMADHLTDFEASESLTYRAADQLVSGDPKGEVTVSMSKLYGAELIRRLVLDCAHAYGGYGFMKENYVARCARGVQNWGIGLCPRAKIFGMARDGTFAEKIVVAASCALPLPDGIAFEHGAILADAVATAYHARATRAGIRGGESVVVIGCGGVGYHAILLARLLGAKTIVAADASKGALRRARAAGADATVDVTTPGSRKAIRRAAGAPARRVGMRAGVSAGAARSERVRSGMKEAGRSKEVHA